MECQDYLSFSQKPTKTLRPPPRCLLQRFYQRLSQNLQTFQMFLPPHTTFYQNNLYICETLPKKDEIKSLKAKKNITMKNLLSSIILTIGMLSCASCTDLMKDDGSRGFANVATIVGDAENGFYCYQRHYADLVVSHSKELAGKERGYFNFYYTEDDWTTSTNGMKYIDNAQVYTIEAYETVHPLTQEEADAGHITGNENCTIPQSLSIDYASYGYVDLQAGFSTFNHINGEIHNGEVNLVYDATKQEPDTLRLQLCYNPRIPDGWTKTSHHFRTVSCDISSLSSLQQWSDSLTLVIDDGSKKASEKNEPERLLETQPRD